MSDLLPLNTIQPTLQEPTLPVMEAFYTLQGEGAHSGKAAYFVRLGGCDVKESWDASLHPLQTVPAIVEAAKAYPGRMVVVTGGEPLMHDLTYLTQTFHEEGFMTNIETSGVYPITGSWDWICFSPKKFKQPHEGIYECAHELKVIIYNGSDFDFAEEHAERVGGDCILLLQPEWSRSDKMLPQIIEYIQSNPKWKMSLQTHKYMNIP